MYIQDKVSWSAGVEKNLALLKTLGVDCVAIDIPDGPRTDSAVDLSTPESAAAFFRKAKATVEAHGLELRTVLATSGFDEIKKGTAGRDQKIALLLNAVRAMGAAGIPILAYNFKLLNSKLLRSAPTKGRGAATYISFDYNEYLKKPAAPVDPPISEEKMWDNITYFLNAMVPAAEKSGVRMALHPDDPPVPHGIPPLAGGAHIASNFDQFRRIFDIVPSRSNGMLFCQGCVTEMKGVDVYDAIRQMAAIDKIVMVHFRNVRGSFPRFQETFVDDGDVDMYRAMQAYRDAGFKGPYSLDHSPIFPEAQIANQAFVIGYLRALIQSVYR
ncbi:MAG TPA: mannonate dehydratase [Burkholderiales bacterium]|nr:mannonate dehydratase [Burkholderiales bacterium]